MIYILFVFSLYLSVFVSAINRDTFFISILFSFFAICLGLILILKNSAKIKLPKYFILMLCFTLILQAYLFFIQNKLNPFYYAILMGEGLLYWLIFFNLKDGDKILKNILIRFSLAYSLLYLASILFNISLIKLAELIFAQEVPTRHYHLGVLWAITIIAVVGMEFKKIKFKQWLVICLGIIFLALSSTRSAYLSLSLGLGYIIAKKITALNLSKRILIPMVILIAGLFVFSSMGRTTLQSRPYFIQSIQAFSKYPLGVGMGNFKLIEKEFQQNGVSDKSLSIYTHNIFLETLSGVGIFSIIFLIFLICLIFDVLKTDGNSVVWGAVIIAILINFMIDTSYTVPSLVWMLFMAIGVFQSKNKLFISS